ncbi:N-acetyltransferase [Allostella vacuolata]|nr:N-acetyltransferase [Stella vacuolata]
MTEAFTAEPATPDRLGDIERVLDDCADGRQCSCAYWRRSQGDYVAGRGAGNREWFRRLVAEGPPPGIVGYVGGDPAGWCGVGPRAAFGRLARARALAPLDARPVWSVNCFIVRKAYRRRGVAGRLLEAAVAFAASHGADMVEGYPVDRALASPGVSLYPGTLGMFQAAGFSECIRRLPTRPIVRLEVSSG